MDKVEDRVTDNDTDKEMDTILAEGMFMGIARHTDMATHTVTETDTDKNYHGVDGWEGSTPLQQ